MLNRNKRRRERQRDQERERKRAARKFGPRVSFSYENFPHLWDDILGYACTEVIRDVRLVSRALRQAVDRRVRHLAMFEPLQVRNWRSYPANKLQCCWAEAWAVDRASRPGLRLPFQVLQYLEGWDKGVLAEHIKLTRLTRTLDIVGYFRGDYNDLNFFAYGCGNLKNGLFPRLRTLRLLLCHDGTFTPYIPIPAETVVLCPSPKGLAANKSHSCYRALYEVDEMDEDDEVVEITPPWPTPESPPYPDLLRTLMCGVDAFAAIRNHVFSRIVLNLRGRSTHAGDSFHFLFSLRPHVREVVIILPWYSSLDDDGRYDDPKAFDPWDVVDIMRSPWAKYIVVGAEVIGPGCAAEIRATMRRWTRHTVFRDVDYSLAPHEGPRMEEAVRALYKSQADRLYAKSFEEEREARRLDRWRARKAARRAYREAQNLPVNDNDLHRRKPFTYALSCGCCIFSDDPDYGLDEEEEVKLPRMSLAQKHRDRMKQLEFLTLQEYRARVGDEDAALHVITSYKGE